MELLRVIQYSDLYPEEASNLPDAKSFIRVWKSTDFHKKFSSTLEVLDEMRSIRCIEHTGKSKHITPFVGVLIDIANAFDFKIPDNCAPKYTSRKKDAPRRGRPAKPKTTELES